MSDVERGPTRRSADGWQESASHHGAASRSSGVRDDTSESRRPRATTWAISRTACTRTMCAPASTAAVTAAAVAPIALGGGRRSRRAAASGTTCATARRATGRPSSRELVEPRQHLVAVRRRPWRTRCPGSTMMRSRGMPAPTANADALAQLVEHLVHDVVVGRLLRTCRCDRPRVCIRMIGAPRRATTLGQLRLVAQAADVVDDGGARARAPRRRPPPCRCRSEIGTATRPASPSMTGSTRRRSSASVDRRGAGPRDSPPTSRCRRRRPPSARRVDRRAAGRASAPPSENESGVTLRMPMTSVRSPSSSVRPPGSGRVNRRRGYTSGTSGRKFKGRRST